MPGDNGVVIVTYNRLELLKECLRCVISQTTPFSHVIVVDNCSTDGTTEYLERLEASSMGWEAEVNDGAGTPPGNAQFHVIYEQENLGGAGGFYDGMALADTLDLQWLLIIDDDAMIRPDYMEILMAYAAGHPDVRALAGSVYVDGRIHTMHRRLVTSEALFVEKEIPETEYAKEAFPCECATFCGLAVRGDVMRRIGLPRKEYFIWYDDSEYSLRINRTGVSGKGIGNIMCIPAAGLDHKTTLPKETEGLLQRTSWRHYYGYRNRYDTANIYFGRISTICIRLEYHILSFLSRCMILRPATRAKGRFNVEMIHDALTDARNGTLGRNVKY